MKIKKIISGLAAALIISSLSTLLTMRLKLMTPPVSITISVSKIMKSSLLVTSRNNIVCSINLLLIMSTHSLN